MTIKKAVILAAGRGSRLGGVANRCSAPCPLVPPSLVQPRFLSGADPAVTTQLLTAPELPRVKQCAGRGCSWLFLDTSKNGSRRWCEMEVCGSRAKARAYYARRKAGTHER